MYSWWSLSSWRSHQYPIYISLLPYACYIPCPSYPPWLDRSNYIWQSYEAPRYVGVHTQTLKINLVLLISVSNENNILKLFIPD
jgi:hypothetical protein